MITSRRPFFLPARTTPIHTMLDNARFATLPAQGTVVRDWLAGFVADPLGVSDRVDEGTIAATFGVAPFSCL